uniref:FHA domain-containing protein n=1 Tax=Herbidospora sakaeratensis TaxID=564415 RepID=UPI000786342C|nr:FHA domain-containing protein [Herbidospora sakaeratensis]
MSGAPRLIVISRPIVGVTFDIPDGHTEIGSLPGSAIRLDMDGVSRRHASLDRAGDQVVLNDLGSRNGTRVNGQKIGRAYALRPGDRLQIGLVELQFLHATAPASPGSYGFGDVHGPVNAGRGTQYVGGHHQIAGRDIYGDDYAIHVDGESDPMDEVFGGRGFGRVLAALGWIVALTGFGIWMALILGTMTGVFPSGPRENPFAREVLGIPMPIAGFGLAAAGGILAGIGSSMSKAARKRYERRNRRRRPH